jgi:outer membrane protein insertion porin family
MRAFALRLHRASERAVSIATASLLSPFFSGGGRGIRTPERVTPLTVFKTAAFNHSAIPPPTILADATSVSVSTPKPAAAGARRIEVVMLRMRSLSLLGCFAWLAVAQTSRTPKAAPPPGVIHSVTVEGNKLYQTSDILKVLALKPGTPATPEGFKAAQGRLLATDLFSNAAYDFRFSLGKPAQYDVTYKVSEFDQVFPLQFEELGVPDDALRSYLRTHVPLYSDKIPPTDNVLHRYASAAQQFVVETNPALKVKAYVSPDNPEHPVVIIGPDRPAPRVAGVEVSGNQAIETPVLQRALNDVAVGQRLSDGGIHQILDKTLKPMYAAKGYMAVTFPKIDTEKSKENEGYVVRVQIQEGPVFRFGTSAFRGGEFTADDIRPMMHYQKGEVFDATKAEQLRHDVAESLRRKGHLNANVDLNRDEDDKNLTINLAYVIVPGPVYTFQTLNVHGLDIESEPQIRKLWGEKPGKPFNPDYPDFFLKRVREMGIFDNLGSTRSKFTPEDSTHTVMVDLFFNGAQGEIKKARQQGQPTPGQNNPSSPQQ